MTVQSPLDKDCLYLQRIDNGKEQFMLMAVNWPNMAAARRSELMSEAETRQLLQRSGMPDTEIDRMIASARSEP